MAGGRKEWPRCIKPGCNMRVMKEGKTCLRCAPTPKRVHPPASEETKRKIQEKRTRRSRSAGTLSGFEGF
jgi:hypothetical protein